MLKANELIVLWGSKERALTVGLARRHGGWDVVASVSPDTLRITTDCPETWWRPVIDSWFALKAGDPARIAAVAALATHELEPPRYQSIRPIAPAEAKS